ncbi:magnesium transporter CorA family protein [Polymorphobacter megasporae]|uniref:magnesium transporter CorA family protein n=1 Tax=Glacieibacterium megasporae TaxID=2835787 RepID=UPI001C1E345F|nr:magnesium transporter CorA family protein [Polymorphobacter megasporae]UAJ11635.1 magnesium transporter CorA family protein [Polymorphobacter megasporae]
MLQLYSAGEKRVTCDGDLTTALLPPGIVWLDLNDPSKAEEAFVERVLGIAVPTRDEMVEIEPSSRLYQDGDTVVVIASLLAGAAEATPITTAVSFVLTPTHLVTIRYAAPKAFELFSAHVERSPTLCTDATMTLIHLLDAIVDRMADVLEGVGAEMDNISKSTFRRGGSRTQRMTNAALQVLLTRIGHVHDIVSKSRVSGVSLARLISFLGSTLDPKGTKEHLDGLAKDVSSLTDHASYLSGNITFLLDAALGLINIEQNAIIKIFSVAAVIFMPPTLVASIYGMNFKNMPELNFHYGYPMALGIMVCSAVLPYQFFKSRGWL